MAYILIDSLKNYLLSYSDTEIVRTKYKYEAIKFFSLRDAEIVMSKINKMKKIGETFEALEI